MGGGAAGRLGVRAARLLQKEDGRQVSSRLSPQCLFCFVVVQVEKRIINESSSMVNW